MFERDLAALRKQFGHKPTNEELCQVAQYELRHHWTAWKILNDRQASPDYFKAIIAASLYHRERSFEYIFMHSRNKDDLLFVATRKNNFTTQAAQKVIQHQLTAEELKRIISVIEDAYLFSIVFAIVWKYRHNICALEAALPDVYDRFETKLRKRGVPFYMIGRRYVKEAMRGKDKPFKARIMLDSCPGRETYALILDAMRNDYTTDFLDNVKTHCLTQRGIDWYKACAYLPKVHPIPMPFKECIETLVSIHNQHKALRILFLHSALFRSFAAGALLSRNNTRFNDVRFILQVGTYRMQYKAAMFLANKKNVRLRLLIFAWRHGNKARDAIEQKILTYRNKNARKFLAQYAPDIYEKLKMKYPKKFRT